MYCFSFIHLFIKRKNVLTSACVVVLFKLLKHMSLVFFKNCIACTLKIYSFKTYFRIHINQEEGNLYHLVYQRCWNHSADLSSKSLDHMVRGRHQSVKNFSRCAWSCNRKNLSYRPCIPEISSCRNCYWACTFSTIWSKNYKSLFLLNTFRSLKQ